MPYITPPGSLRFFYQQAGSGADVVLLHPVTGNLAVWMFSGLFDALSAQFRVTAYDLRGHGQSDAPPSGYTSADMAHDFRCLHEALGLGKAFLVGHSYGAVVAVHAAVLYPDLVAGLLLSDPYFPGLAEVEPNLGQSHVWQDLKQTLVAAGAQLGDRVDFSLLFREVAALTPEQMGRVRERMGPAAVRWLGQLPRLAQTTCGDDAFAVAGLTARRLAAVRQPIVALYDEHTPFEATRRWLAENVPNCTVDIVPEARHMAPLQNPVEFTGLVQKHLRQMAAASR
jgi:pimeloyl-ACP methyl ester carboxylesterase